MTRIAHTAPYRAAPRLSGDIYLLSAAHAAQAEASRTERRATEARRRVGRIRRGRLLALMLLALSFSAFGTLVYSVAVSPIGAVGRADLPLPVAVEPVAPTAPAVLAETNIPDRPASLAERRRTAMPLSALGTVAVAETPPSPWISGALQAVAQSPRPPLRPAEPSTVSPLREATRATSPRGALAPAAADSVPAVAMARISAVCNTPVFLGTYEAERPGRAPVVEYLFSCADAQ